MRIRAIVFSVAAALTCGAANPMAQTSRPAPKAQAAPAAVVIMPRGVVRSPADPTCIAALRLYVSDTAARLQQKPPGQTAPPRQAALACATDEATRSGVCQHALGAAHADVAATAAGGTKLTDAQVASLAASIAQDMHSCAQPQQPPADACRTAHEIAEFDIGKLRRADPPPAHDVLEKETAQLRKVAADACNAALDLQRARLEQSVCDYKQRHLTDFLRSYYGRNALDVMAGNQETTSRLEITKATFGDLRYGHTCDATRYMERRCRTLQGSVPAGAADTDEVAGAGFCLIRRTGNADQELRTDLCGYDPSPQADLRIRIEYTCGGSEQKRLDLPSEAAKINLICKLPDNPRHLRLLETSASKISEELKFFKAPPCPVKFEP